MPGRRIGRRKRGLPADNEEHRPLLIDDIYTVLINHKDDEVSASEFSGCLRHSMGSWEHAPHRWSFGPRFEHSELDEILEEIGVEIIHVRTKPNKYNSTQIRATYYKATPETKEKYEIELMTERMMRGSLR